MSKQGWLPNARITLNSTAATVLKGTLTVTLYKGTPGGSSLDNCTAGTATATGYSKSFAIDTSTPAPGTNTVTVFTDNSSFFVGVNPANGNASANDGDGSYFWLIHYVDNSRTSPNDRCETSSISHNDG